MNRHMAQMAAILAMMAMPSVGLPSNYEDDPALAWAGAWAGAGARAWAGDKATALRYSEKLLELLAAAPVAATTTLTPRT